MNASVRLAAAALLGISALAPAAAAEDARAAAEASYQAGVEQYARGRFARARADFKKALLLDPRHRAASVGLERIRVEHASDALSEPFRPPRAARARLGPAGLRAEAETAPLAAAMRLFFFERTVGDARNALGRLAALQGRIAQLETERRVCRARGRAFGRAAELRALSRRLPEIV